MPHGVQAYNLATGNKWIALLPLQKIISSYSPTKTCLNLCNFSIPELAMVENRISFNGSSVPIPGGHVRNDSKLITFNYMLASDWSQFRSLYTWFSLISNEEGAASTNNMSDYMCDISVILLSEYKNPIFKIKYVGCWLKSLAEIEENYQGKGENIKHSFTIAYAYYKIEDVAKI
jgi:hypothetical protein